MNRLINVTALYADHGIPTAPATNKHFSQEWVNTHCPFCEGSKNFHLGYHRAGGYFHCYRCGWKPTRLALAGILGTSERVAWDVARQYFARRNAGFANTPEITPPVIHTYLPRGTIEISSNHAAYLRNRGFDPKALVRTWKLKGTGPTAKPQWRWRIVIPIYHDRHLVSYTTRAMSDRGDKYRACPKEQELLHHRHTLYGLDLAPGPVAIVVEGPVDVWRIGPGAVATFGTEVKPAQRVLLSRFKKLIIAFDSDSHGAGQKAGEKLAWQMSGMGVETEQVLLPMGVDPGSLSENQVNVLRHML